MRGRCGLDGPRTSGAAQLPAGYSQKVLLGAPWFHQPGPPFPDSPPRPVAPPPRPSYTAAPDLVVVADMFGHARLDLTGRYTLPTAVCARPGAARTGLSRSPPGFGRYGHRHWM
jgi:hypothetical protein